ncbi:MAG: hypothetical protein K8963_02505, partial [Proteobacteria bacterium]|nr:hypothetical protein [Pseudomonadota bacterium]
MYSAHTNHPKTILALVLGSALVSGALAVAIYTSQSQVASRPGTAVGDSSSHASGLTYTVEHQHIVFSWQPVDGVLHYRLLASTSPASDADDEFSTVLGAGQIKQNVFRLRIRHWNVDWSSTRYQLQACPPAALPCRVLDEVELTPEDAERAVA